MSNLYTLEKGYLTMSPNRVFSNTPLIKLGDQNFKKVSDFLKRFGSIPDIIDLDHLTVSGNVNFGKDVVLSGTVIIIANYGDQVRSRCNSNCNPFTQKLNLFFRLTSQLAPDWRTRSSRATSESSTINLNAPECSGFAEQDLILQPFLAMNCVITSFLNGLQKCAETYNKT